MRMPSCGCPTLPRLVAAMADRVPMLSPLGKGTARVPAKRVSEFEANGWRQVTPAKPKRRKRTSGDEDEK